MSATSSGSLTPATVPTAHRTGYRPVTAWQAKVARKLNVRPATVRDWLETVRQRTQDMISAMVECGAPALAAEWLADFEAAFCVVATPWSTAVKLAVAADAREDVQRDEFLLARTDEAERLYETSLRKEIAAKLTELRSLEARKRV